MFRNLGVELLGGREGRERKFSFRNSGENPGFELVEPRFNLETWGSGTLCSNLGSGALCSNSGNANPGSGTWTPNEASKARVRTSKFSPNAGFELYVEVQGMHHDVQNAELNHGEFEPVWELLFVPEVWETLCWSQILVLPFP